MDDDKYPHWRDALFGNNDAVANIRCAIHYVFWHAVYAIIGFFGIISAGAAKIALAAAPYFGPLAAPIERVVSGALSAVFYVLDHRYTERLLRYGSYVFVALAAVYVAGMFVFVLINDPFLLLGGLSLAVGLIGVAAILTFIYNKIRNPAKSAATGVANSARAAGERAVETPGIRRVYGECPVSISQPPRWFDDLFNDDEDEF